MSGSKRVIALVVLGSLSNGAVAALVWFSRELTAHCDEGFVAKGPYCSAVPAGGACPPPLVVRGEGCDAPDTRILVPEGSFVIGPSDWEAEGRVPARTVHAGPFYLDAFEATVAKVTGADSVDGARAAASLSRTEAASYCVRRGGRLPSDDEWLLAAAGKTGRRYPWGDTGAVCRRAAWGLVDGPCGRGATAADTVGAHAAGKSELGIFDLAGNVAEWVADDLRAANGTVHGLARGGSFKTGLATDLRTWNRWEIASDARDPAVGVRCAYDAP